MKKIILAVAVAAVASMAVASFASAGVDRYQTQTATLTVSARAAPTSTPTRSRNNPCDGSFTGTGGIASARPRSETISGTLNGQNITHHRRRTWTATTLRLHLDATTAR